MRRALIFLVLAVLLVQPSLWTLCASHCDPEAQASDATVSASEECHDAASASANHHSSTSSSDARLTANPACTQPPSVEAQPLAELTRHDLATATVRLTAAAGAAASAALPFTFAPPTSAVGVLRAPGSFSLNPPRTSAPVILRI